MGKKLVGLALGLVLVAGCGGGGQTSKTTSTEKKAKPAEAVTAEQPGSETKGDIVNFAKGKALFATNCVTCHGESGDGTGPAASGLTPPPANFTDKSAMAKISDDEMFKAIKEGGAAVGKSPVMPAQPQMSNSEIRSLIAYIRSLAK